MKWYSILLIVIAIIIILLIIIFLSIKAIINISIFRMKVMSVEKLLKLPDDRLNIAILFNINERYKDIISEEDKINLMSDCEKTFYVVMLYEIEFINGGLCQYFINSSKESAPFLSDELLNIGATKTEKLFSNFVAENKIDINNLDEFVTATHDDYIDLLNSFPFEEYDNEGMDIYENSENLQKILSQFARDNIDKLAN